MNPEPLWSAIYEHTDFEKLVKRRRRLISLLMFISMAVYFAIPIFSAYFPALLAYKVYGAINVGLIYLIGQYFFGAAIAVFYAYRLKSIDKMAASLVTDISLSSDHDNAKK